ncbi:MAG: low specificity L-threonine aldolase, partial [Bacteroidetes bacterium]|nr:low specificity L-threonine aldolase [Bacteroidota bacterium]
LSVDEALEKCKEKGLLLSVGRVGSLRAITHLDVSDEDVKETIRILKEVFE